MAVGIWVCGGVDIGVCGCESLCLILWGWVLVCGCGGVGCIGPTEDPEELFLPSVDQG